ncbi:MAG: 30S ribosomal protein S6 [Candidatus Marinimicrobia bacterium]|nr:30S ribosomal protein S6 [Candidatus Neomarinimicrobiota bacterium]
MRYYEMLFIVHPNYEQDRLDAVISSVQKEITSKGAKILKIDNWGKRKLAYLINKQRYGSYVLMYFEADPNLIQGLYEWMEIQAQVLHQIIIRLEEKPELTEESQNPDSPSASYIRPAAHAKAGTSTEKVKKAVVKKVVKEEVVEEKSSSAEAMEDKVVKEVVEEEVVEKESSSAEAMEDKVVKEVVEEEVVEKESSSAEAIEDKVVEEVVEEKVVEEEVEEKTTKEEGE